MENSVESIVIESKRTAEEELLKFLPIKETVLVWVKLYDQVAKWFHLFDNTVPHLSDQKSIKCSVDPLCKFGDAEVDPESALTLSHMLEQYLHLLVAHIEVVVSDLLEALLELIQGHHFCALRIYQLLEGLLCQISGFHKLLCQFKKLSRNKVHLRDSLDFSKQLSVFQPVHVHCIQYIFEHSLLLGSYLDTYLVESSVHILLKERAKVLNI